MGHRIGPRMRQAVLYVQRHPGVTKSAVSREVGPRGSTFYGWRTVQRCLWAGLIVDIGTPGRSRLYATIADLTWLPAHHARRAEDGAAMTCAKCGEVIFEAYGQVWHKLGYGTHTPITATPHGSE